MAVLPDSDEISDFSGWKMSPTWIEGCRILVVQDECEDRAKFAMDLARCGNTVTTASTVEGIVKQVDAADAVVLDMKLNAVHSLVACTEIRHSSPTPILLMTDRASELDCILGLQAGADDYLVRPFGTLELMARISARARRLTGTGTAPMSVISNDDLTIDPANRRVQLAGHEIRTTRKEFDLLYLLAVNSSQVVPRETLLAEVWGGTWSQRTLDTHVSSLRHKLGSAEWIVTVRGIGFKLGAPGSLESVRA